MSLGEGYSGQAQHPVLLAKQQLAQTQPTAMAFFEQALTQERLSQAYVLTGGQLSSQYQLALLLATVLNCQEPVDALTPCGQCRSCLWMKTNAHPLIRTVSPLTSLFDKQKLDPNTVTIKTDQLSQLAQLLATCSGETETKVLIFTGATTVEGSVKIDDLTSTLLPYEWTSHTVAQKYQWQFAPLTGQVFSPKSANQFLKWIEEPHPRTMYFFLTQEASSLLPTIVSRCQVMPLRYEQAPSQAVSQTLSEPLLAWLTTLLQDPPQDPYPLMESLASLNLLQELVKLQRYLQQTRDIFKTLAQYQKGQQFISQAMVQLSQRGNESTILWQLTQQLSSLG
jgi:hypothetical protein